MMSLIKPSVTKLSGRTIAESYLLTKFIAAGACGAVYYALNTVSTEQPEYAIKVQRKRLRSRRRLAALRREIELHHRVSTHPNVVTLHRTFEDSDFVYVFLDFKPFDLFTAIVEKKFYWMQGDLLKEAFCGLIDAVAFCHDQGVYHGGTCMQMIRVWQGANARLHQ